MKPRVCIVCRVKPIGAHRHPLTTICSERCRRQRRKVYAKKHAQAFGGDALREYKREWQAKRRADPAYRAAELERKRDRQQRSP